jgi:hypothetical protein
MVSQTMQGTPPPPMDLDYTLPTVLSDFLEAMRGPEAKGLELDAHDKEEFLNQLTEAITLTTQLKRTMQTTSPLHDLNEGLTAILENLEALDTESLPYKDNMNEDDEQELAAATHDLAEMLSHTNKLKRVFEEKKYVRAYFIYGTLAEHFGRWHRSALVAAPPRHKPKRSVPESTIDNADFSNTDIV